MTEREDLKNQDEQTPGTGENGINRHNVTGEISDALEPIEAVERNEAAQMLSKLYNTLSRPMNLLTSEEAFWVIKNIESIGKWDKETFSETIEDIRNLNALNIHKINFLVSFLESFQAYDFNGGQLIHLMGTLLDTHKMSTDPNSIKTTPLLSLLMVAPEKPVAWWEKKEHTNIELIKKRLEVIHQEINEQIEAFTKFLSEKNQVELIQQLMSFDWVKDNYLFTIKECEAFTTWLQEDERYGDQKLVEVKETIKMIGGALSSQYKALNTLVQKVSKYASLGESETQVVIEKYDELIKTEADKENFQVLTKMNKPFADTNERIRLLKQSVINVLKYLLHVIEMIEGIDRSKLHKPVLIENNPEQLKSNYGTKSIGEIFLNSELMHQSLEGNHTAFIRIDMLMHKEGEFFKNICEYTNSPVSKLSEETIAYMTTILDKVYMFDDMEYEDFFNQMSCTKGINIDQIAQLTKFFTALRGLSPEEFRNLVANIYHILLLVKNNAQWVEKQNADILIDPLTINVQGLIDFHEKSVTQSYEVIKRPLYPKNFHEVVWEISGYKEKKNFVIGTIKRLMGLGMITETKCKTYIRTINNIAIWPENQNIYEFASIQALKQENRKLNDSDAQTLSQAIIEYYNLFKNIEVILMFTQEQIIALFHLTQQSQNQHELLDKLLQEFTVNSQVLTDKDCSFLAETITLMQQFFAIELTNENTHTGITNVTEGISVAPSKDITLQKLLSERNYGLDDMKWQNRLNSTKKSKNVIENILIDAGINKEDWAMQLAMYLFVDRGSEKDPWIANMIFSHPELSAQIKSFITQTQLVVLQKTGKQIVLTDSLFF